MAVHKLWSRKGLWLMIVLLLVAFAAVEITLRKVWGFADTVLYDEDPELEYIAQPNQNRFRFGNRVVYNEFSMRSDPIDKSDGCIILGFGDSVINGGVLTDQDSLATTIVEKELNKRVRFLNISAGSWGPDNCAAYLKNHGDFGAKMVILFVSSHDAHDNITHEKIVGVHESYPETQYSLAIAELFNRYLAPRISYIFFKRDEKEALMINKNGKEFNTGFEFIKGYCLEKGIPLVLCLHAERKEIEQRQFNSQGQEIIEFCVNNDIKLISGLDIGEEMTDFRDDIHINEKGQKRWAAVLSQEIRETAKGCF